MSSVLTARVTTTTRGFEEALSWPYQQRSDNRPGLVSALTEGVLGSEPRNSLRTGASLRPQGDATERSLLGPSGRQGEPG